MSILNKQDAMKIAKKLEAEIDTSPRAHDIAVIFEDGVEVVSFGLRRGKKDLGHDHIMRRPRGAHRAGDGKRPGTLPVFSQDELGNTGSHRLISTAC